jgi:hypothetical protein
MTTEEKIRKLLDLAGSPNEHEAKLAMDRARELMAKYCITIEDRPEEKPEVIYEIYTPPIRVNNANFKYTTMIVNTLSKHFGVILIIDMTFIRIYGFPKSIKLAFYAFDTIFNQLNAAFRIGYSHERSITFSESFWYGAAFEIHRKFSLTKEQSVGLIVYDPVQAKVAELNVAPIVSNCNPSSRHGIMLGTLAGQEASFYKGVESKTESGNLLQRKYLLLKKLTQFQRISL